MLTAHTPRSRRRIGRLGAALALTASLAAAGAASAATDDSTPAPLEHLRIHHPETLAFAAPFALIDTEGSAAAAALAGVADEVSTDVWTTPDVLRSLLVNGESDVTAVPTYVGANLFNRGVDVRLAAVTVWGLLWLLGPEGTTGSWEELRGQTVMVPYANDMPDLVFRYLAAANGLTPGEDFTIEYYAQPPEVVARLVAGEGTWAVLPEHVATVAELQAGQNGHPVARAFDLQAEWASATGGEPRIPQAGIVVPGQLAVERPDVVAAVLDALDDSVQRVDEAAPETLEVLAEASGVPAPVVAQVIPRLHLDVVSAGEVRPELERFYTELATLSPDIIGGSLPADDFYLDDPR